MLFAHLKRILKLNRLLLRGLSGEQDEFMLADTTQNLRRMAKKLMRMPNKEVRSSHKFKKSQGFCGASVISLQTINKNEPPSRLSSVAPEFFNTIAQNQTLLDTLYFVPANCILFQRK